MFLVKLRKSGITYERVRICSFDADISHFMLVENMNEIMYTEIRKRRKTWEKT